LHAWKSIEFTLRCKAENKVLIAEFGGIPKLVRLAEHAPAKVRVEAIAALANLAVNGVHAVVSP
jgi:hypothetical protein